MKVRLQAKARSGFTLVEVIVAIVLILVVTLGMGAFMVQFIRAVAGSSLRSTANELVAERLEIVKGATVYSTLESQYGGTEQSIPNHPGYVRQTLITHVGGAPTDLYDYRIVTVIVSGSGLANPIKKSTVVSAF